MREHEPKPTRREHLLPKLAWSAIAGFVVLYDTICPKNETLSEQMDRWREDENTAPMADFMLDSIYKHLKRSIPEDEDWIHNVAKLSPKRDKPQLDGSDRFDIFPED